MKKFTILMISTCAILLIVSCSTKLQEVPIKPISTQINGPISDYLQVVDNSYKVYKSSEKTMGGGYWYSIKVNIANVSPIIHEFFDLNEITLTILDKQGNPLTGIAEFELGA